MRRLAAASPYLALAALTLAFFAPLAFSPLILARGDTYTYFYPYWAARDAAFSAGRLPLWTTDVFMGVPLLANSQLGTLYPPNWLTLGLPAPDAIRVSVLLHIAWAGLGAALLARQVLRLLPLPALLVGALFAFGGHVGAHVEQINQLQGLAWMPWLFACYAHSLGGPPPRRRFVLLLAMCWAMQLLAGHTQIAFISGVGLGVMGLHHALTAPPLQSASGGFGRLRAFLPLLAAAALAVLLALPQLLPTQELASLSNRGGGLTTQQAVAFSLNPALVGRSLLPSYDAQPFSEYVAYLGVIGLGLALLGGTTGRAAWVWIALAGVGLGFGLGAYNPLYWLLAGLPGFNLFRVPARWMALFALGMALLAGIGMQRLMTAPLPRWRVGLAAGVLAALMLAALLSPRAADEIDGAALPTAVTWTGWLLALAALLVLSLVRPGRRMWLRLLVGLCVVELWCAAQFLPYRDLADPAVYAATRFPIDLLRVTTAEGVPPGRLLSISGALFDPGDRARLEARWRDLRLSDRAARYAFTATKLQEVVAPNLPLIWGIPSIDGYDGGLLPTLHYTAFSSLLLPPGTLRTVDGRLRENLALPACRGACLPEDRWLDLTHTRFVLVDKVYDLVRDGIFYDTTFPISLVPGAVIALENRTAFEADHLHVLAECAATCPDLSAAFDLDGEAALPLTFDGVDPDRVDGLALLRFAVSEALAPAQIDLAAAEPVRLRAVALVDSRTGDFVPLAPPGWERVYSAEVKIYENHDVLPRAFVVGEVRVFPDTWDGTEQALAAMRDPAFDPRRSATLHAPPGTAAGLSAQAARTRVTFTAYTPTAVTLRLADPAPGLLVLTDAAYPGWRAVDQDGARLPIYRADVMFRGIPITARTTQITLTYTPPLAGFVLGGAAWAGGLAALVLGAVRMRRRASNSSPMDG